LNLLTDTVRDLLVKPLVDDGFERHAPYAATPGIFGEGRQAENGVSSVRFGDVLGAIG
jgi:hypothetical protein